MPAYDAEQFDPPAPLAQVTLRNPDNGAIQSDVPMLLDSGADVTLVPGAVVDLLGTAVVPDRRHELTRFDGSVSLALVVRDHCILLTAPGVSPRMGLMRRRVVRDERGGSP